MTIKKQIATRNEKGKWLWASATEIPKINHYKTFIHKKPELFVEEDGILYLIEINKKRLNQSLTAALKICGSTYALVLMLTGGKKGKEFNTFYSNINNHYFGKLENGKKYITLFEKVIKDYAIPVANVSADNIGWIESDDYPIQLVKIKTLYKVSVDSFYVLNNKLYYLRCIQSVVEDMYWKCTQLAGGDYALAEYFATDEASRVKHYRNLQRLSFKQPKTFTLYATLFSEYLQRNAPLFEVELDD